MFKKLLAWWFGEPIPKPTASVKEVDDRWPRYCADSSNIWATIPPGERKSFLAELEKAERESAAQWNESFRREAETRARGERWDWKRFNDATVADILAQTDHETNH